MHFLSRESTNNPSKASPIEYFPDYSHLTTAQLESLINEHKAKYEDQFRTQNKLFADITKSSLRTDVKTHIIPERYYVIFRTHEAVWMKDPKNPDVPKSFAGHAWVLWAHENPQTMKSEISGYGFWPNQEKTGNSVIIKGELLVGLTAIPTSLEHLEFPFMLVGLDQKYVSGSFGKVPGELHQDLFHPEYSKSTKEMVFEVDKKDYERSLLVIKNYNDTKPDYGVYKKDCVSFMIDVGKCLGLNMPNRTLLNAVPNAYMKTCQSEITSPHKLGILDANSTPLQEDSYVTSNPNGNYSFVLDEKTKNLCSSDNSGAITEKKIRDNNLMYEETTYRNGNRLYQEFPSKPDIDPKILSPIVSDYIYKNGNMILDYKLQNYNPKIPYLVLNTNNEEYAGEIDNSGRPEGTGTLISVDDNGTKISQKIGIFKEGSFESFKRQPRGKLFFEGEDFFKDSLSKGKLIMENGDIFTGTFKNGIPSGICLLVSKDGSINSRGTFMNGKLSGREVKIVKETYDLVTTTTDYINGVANGHIQVSYKSKWGPVRDRVFDGDVVNGITVSGIMRFSVGSFWKATYDPKTGKELTLHNFNAHGVEVPRNGPPTPYFPPIGNPIKIYDTPRQPLRTSINGN